MIINYRFSDKSIRLVSSFILIFFFGFANLSRLLVLRMGDKTFPLTELFFIIIGSGACLYTIKDKRRYFLMILFFVFYNILLCYVGNGISKVSILYLIRFVSIVVSAVGFFSLMETAINSNFNFYSTILKGLLLNTFFGFFFFYAFPDSRDLWTFLRIFGFEFAGDPHMARFYGTFFDPQYYTSILILPFILLPLVKDKKTLAICLPVFLFALYNTASRMALIYLGIISIYFFINHIIKKNFQFLAYFSLCFVATILLSSSTNDYFSFRYERTASRLKNDILVSNEASKNNSVAKNSSKLNSSAPEWVKKVKILRLKTMLYGIYHYSLLPIGQKIFGIGYNAISKSVHQYDLPQRNAYDSSYLNILLSWGGAGLAAFFLLVFKLLKKILIIEHSELRKGLLLYFCLTFSMSMNLNNILFLSFWLVLNIGIFMILSRKGAEVYFESASII